jgi:PAS domain S-box-containing protein
MSELEMVPVVVRPGRFSEPERPFSLFRIEAKMRLQPGALESAGDAIMITDREGVIAWVNPAFTTLTGFTFSEAIGANPKTLIRSGEQEPPFYRELWGTILRGRIWRGEILNRRKDGSIYTEAQTIVPIADSSGRITHFVAVKRDLAVQETSAAMPLPTEESGLNAIGLETILVVDDDAERRRRDTKALRQAGYSVLAAATTAGAMALLESHRGRLDLLFTDAASAAGGRAAAEAVLAARPDIDVLYASCFTAHRLRSREVLDYPTYVLRKPYTTPALLQKVRDILDLRRCTRAA